MIITIENEHGDLLVSTEYMPTTCAHGRPLVTLKDCPDCISEELLQLWMERSELFV